MIIGILILIAIVGAFYRLAFDHERKYPWLYSVIGAISFYGGFYLGVFALAVIYTLLGSVIDEFVLTLMSLPIGAGCCIGLYYILKSNWKKQEKSASGEVLDDQL
ncbi:MAG: hypothetical protein ACO1O6_15205 [Bacteroidota bacterium]